MSVISQMVKADPLTAEYYRLLGKEMSDDKANFDWRARGCKIYPSTLTFTMCPYEFMQNIHIYSGIEDIKGKERTESGKAVHWMIQRRMAASPKFYRGPLCLPTDVAQELSTKFEDGELPLRCLRTGISGKADLPPFKKSNGKWLLVDIKSTSMRPEEWIKLKTINAKYRTQLSIYATIFNRDHYFPFEVNEIGIWYYNLSKDCADPAKFKEIIEPFGLEQRTMTETLLEHLGEERRKKLEGVESSCTYEFCSKHGGK